MVFIDGSIRIPLAIGVFNAIKYAIEEFVVILILQKAVRNISGLWIRNRLRKRSYVLGGTPVLDELALQPNLGREGLSRFLILTVLIIVLHGTALLLELGTDSIEERHVSGVGLVPARTSVIDPGRDKYTSLDEMYERGEKSIIGCVERYSEGWSVFRATEINGTRCSEESSTIRLSDYATEASECELFRQERRRSLILMSMQVQEKRTIVRSDVKVSFMFGNITFIKARVKALYGCMIDGIVAYEDDEIDLGVHDLVCINDMNGISFEKRAICITASVDDGGEGVYMRVNTSQMYRESTENFFNVGTTYSSHRYAAGIFNVTGQWAVRADAVILVAQLTAFGNTTFNLRPLLALISISSVGDFGEVVSTRKTRMTEIVARPTIRIEAVIVYVTVVTGAALTALGVSCFAKGNSSRLNQPLVYAAVLSAHIEDRSEDRLETSPEDSHVMCDSVSRVREIALYAVQDGMSHLGPAPNRWKPHVSGNLILRGKEDNTRVRQCDNVQAVPGTDDREGRSPRQ